MLRQRGRIGLMVAALVALVAAVAGASERTSTEESRSYLLFPKVIANQYRDTIIQISNANSMPAYAHCFYVNAALRFPEEPEGPDNQPLWQEIDFNLRFTPRQPTHWSVSRGRLDNPFDPPCENATSKPTCAGAECPAEPRLAGSECDGAGIDPGRVPPVPQDFVGELKCIEVFGDQDHPFPGEDFTGQATLVTLDSGDVSKYNAIGFTGLNPPDEDGILCLGTSGDPEFCPFGPEYSGCPDVWVINHFGEFMESPERGDDDDDDEDTVVTTDLTIVPCTQNFETQDPEAVTIFAESYDEFETAFSAFIQVTCWRDFQLSDIDEFAFAGPTFRQTFLRSTSASTSGIAVIGEEVHGPKATDVGTDNGRPRPGSRAAFNPVMIGERALDLITIPADQLVPPPVECSVDQHCFDDKVCIQSRCVPAP